VLQCVEGAISAAAAQGARSRKQKAEVPLTVAALNIELQCNSFCLFAVSLRFWRVQYTGVMNYDIPTAIKGTMNLAKASFSRDIFAGTIIRVVNI
jgi:hypothetical protein